ncbi:Plasma-membrane choline transporter [Ceratobasidium sp. AG-Ba]|nr:Plasma-membrane choline transporter [Ceratobasidium sp. AG-Ba]
MPASFSTYASQFLSRSTASTSAQPMFYSVAEGGESQYALGDSTHSRRSAAELDEDGLPFLPGGQTIFDNGENDQGDQEQDEPDSRAATPQRHFASPPMRSQHLNVENPYLDEHDLEFEDNIDDSMPPDSIPLIASPPRSPSPRPRQKPPAAGWLAHLSQSGYPDPGRPRPSRAAMSPPDRAIMNSSSEDEDSDSSEDLPLFPPSPPLPQSRPHAHHGPTPPPPRLARDVDPDLSSSHIDLNESLLPRDGIERSVFTLPDPARTPYRKYNDPVWTALWCTSILFSFIGSIVIIFFTNSHPKAPSIPGRKLTTPFSTLTHTIPLLTLVVVLTSVFGYLYLILLRYFVRPVLTATALAAPLALLLAAIWAFGGSFMWDGDGVGETWGETVGYDRYRRLMQGMSVISLASALVLDHPPLLGLSVGLLVAALVLSIPFLALIFRLMLVGTFVREGITFTWRVKGWAWWMSVLVVGVLMWSWAVVRGALRVTVSGVVAAWYHSPPNTPAPTTQQATDTTRNLLILLRAFRTFATPAVLSTIPLPVPPGIQQTAIRWLVAFAQAQAMNHIVSWLSKYGGGVDVQVLVGVTGEEEGAEGGRARDASLATSLGLGVFAAIGGYIFAAHALSDPTYAPLAALLIGAGTTATVRFCVGVVDDAADALFMCYCLDYEAGGVPREDVREAFEGAAQPGAV